MKLRFWKKRPTPKTVDALLVSSPKPMNWKGSFPLCPYCDKWVHHGSKVCRWCGSEIDA